MRIATPLVLSALLLSSPALCQDHAFKRHRSLAYVEGVGADKVRHTLDLYVPEGVEKPPLVLFIHGGAWRMGAKGWYAGIGRWLARNGYACAQNNYRLTPTVQHPVHVMDCAKALAWLVANAKKYGYDVENVFLTGHSAGGHLSSLLALSPKYLKGEGLKRTRIRGVFPLSGVYDCRSRYGTFVKTFGEEREGREEASPVANIHDKTPPFMVIWADKDMAGLPQDAKRFVAALKKAKRPVEGHEVQGRNHMTITSRIGSDGDEASRLILAFLKKHR